MLVEADPAVRPELRVARVDYRELLVHHLEEFGGLNVTVAQELDRLKAIIEKHDEPILFEHTEFCLSLLRIRMTDEPSVAAQRSFLTSLLRTPHLPIPVLFKMPRPGLASELIPQTEAKDRIYRYGGYDPR